VGTARGGQITGNGQLAAAQLKVIDQSHLVADYSSARTVEAQDRQIDGGLTSGTAGISPHFA
jgi:hypothetical protein